MPERTMLIEGVRVPRFLYGTAWKENETRRLTELAIEQGFRGIDTANQRRHYHEAAVGQAISASVARGLMARDDLFLQTKFTFRRGHDRRLPYDPDAPIPIQVGSPARRQQRHPGTTSASMPESTCITPLRPEPLLRGPRLGPSGPGVLRRSRTGLSRLFVADRQPRGDGRSRTGANRRTIRSDGQPDRLPLRS